MFGSGSTYSHQKKFEDGMFFEEQTGLPHLDSTRIEKWVREYLMLPRLGGS